MGQLLQELMRRPIVFLFVAIWLVGVISNQVKARQKANERREARSKAAPAANAAPAEANVTTVAKAKVDGVMGNLGDGERAKLAGRREFPDAARSDEKQKPMQAGMSQQPSMRAQSTQPSVKRAPAKPTPARGQSPEAIAQEMRRILGLDPGPAPAPPVKPPLPKQPQVSEPDAMLTEHHLDLHEASRVGEGIRDRHLKKSKVGQTKRAPSSRGAIGNLGGRVQVNTRQEVPVSKRRYAMDDLRRAIVLNEILSPPVTMRSAGRRQV